jgi:hypothetical protein
MAHHLATVLPGHTSAETAYLVEDYPYGFRLRCKIRYWLEYKARLGYRLVSQTTNPKRSFESWNKPKASTYCQVGVMGLDEQNHVQWHGLSGYADDSEIAAYREAYAAFLDDTGQKALATLELLKRASHRITYTVNPGGPSQTKEQAQEIWRAAVRAEIQETNAGSQD